MGYNNYNQNDSRQSRQNMQNYNYGYNRNYKSHNVGKIIIITVVSVLVLSTLSFLAGALLFKNSGGNALATPNNVRVVSESGKDYLRWEKVSNANWYVINFGNDSLEVANSNSLELSSLQVGMQYSLQVKSVGQSQNDSGWSSIVNYKKEPSNNTVKLSAPNITLSGTTLQWSAISNASSYEIFDGSQAIRSDYTSNSFDVSSLGYGSFILSVRANGDGINYSNSDTSNTVSYENNNSSAVKLATPSNVSVSDYLLSWGSVSNASGYNVMVDSNIYSVSSGTSYNFSSLGLSVGTHTLSVQAKGDGTNFTNSDWSSPVSYTVENNSNQLNKPTIKLNGKQLTWDAISGANSYLVSVAGSESVANATSYDLSYLTAYNTYETKVKAIGNSTTIDSDWSNSIWYTISDNTGSTSPDAVADRFSKYISRDYYEQLFPNRFGTRNWKDDVAEIHAFYPDEEFRESRTDYYSYDNFIEAIKTLAALKAVYEWDDGQQYLVSVENVNTGVVRNITPSRLGVKKGVVRESVVYGDFLNSNNENDNKRELSALFAHLSKESGAYTWVDPDDVSEWTPDKYTWGLAFNEETSYINSTGDTYSAYDHPDYPPVSGHSYHGRGPIQLTWNYNYGFFSELIFGDKNVLLQNPERVSEEGVLGIMSALWFWMTPQAPKASCHDIMLNYFVPDTTGAYSVYYNCFGLTIVVVNGAYESDKLPSEWPQVKTRIDFYKRYTSTLGADIEGEKLDTKGFPQWGGW